MLAVLEKIAERQKNRPVTQRLARGYFDEGRAGIIFCSNLDNKKCLALFEGRAELIQLDDPIPLSPDMTAFQNVCHEFNLKIVN